MKNVVVVSAVRLPIGRQNGAYKNLTSQELAVLAGRALVKRFKADFGKNFPQLTIDDHIVGNAPLYPSSDTQHIYSVNFAHALGLGHVPSHLVQKICGTGYQVITTAVDRIRAEQNKIVLVYAAESMTNAPQVSTAARRDDDFWSFGDGRLNDYILRSLQHDQFDTNMAATAELVGKEMKYTLQEIAAFSAESHRRAANAIRRQWNVDETKLDPVNGYLAGVMPVRSFDKKGNPVNLWYDEGVRFKTSAEEIMKTPPIPGCNLVRAGTASQISDAAAAMILMEEDLADKLGLNTGLYVKGYSEATCDPRRMGLAPVPAITEYLQEVQKAIADFDVVYINEAFAPQVKAVKDKLGIPCEKFNPNGGAIAIGHPITATGLCISVDILHEMRRMANAQSKEIVHGLASACIGGGQATVVEFEYRGH